MTLLRARLNRFFYLLIFGWLRGEVALTLRWEDELGKRHCCVVCGTGSIHDDSWETTRVFYEE